MFSYTKKEIVILAKELNVQKQTLERVLRLIDVLKFFNTDEDLKDKLVLKGGTAINLTFYNCLRLSVDIDLDYVGSNDKEQMKSDRLLIESKLLYFMQESNMQYRKDKTKLDEKVSEISRKKRMKVWIICTFFIFSAFIGRIGWIQSKLQRSSIASSKSFRCFI